MANISKLLRLATGVDRQVDLSVNTLVVSDLQINSINLRSTAGSGASGSDGIGDDNSYTNFTPAAATVKGALSGIDAALTTAAGANKTLSNLTSPTSVNQALIPSGSGTLDLGSSSVVWNHLWAQTVLYPSGPAISLQSGYTTDSSGAHSLDWASRLLVDSAGTTQLAWSTSGVAFSQATATTVPYLNGSKILTSSAVTPTELGYLSGVTSAIQTQFSGKLSLTGGTLSGALNMGSNQINAVADPTSAQDAATKHYVDNLAAGITWKNAARVASTANVSVSSAPSTIDGVTLTAGDRILLKNQTAGAENGIYVFSAAAAALTRATDMATWAEVVGAVLLVTEGSVNTGSKWVNSNVAGGTLGTTAITFVAFSVAGTVNGTGTTNYVAYWSGTATLTAEQFLSATRGGLGADASGFTGVLKAASGVFSASTIVNADVSGSAAIAYSKLALTGSIVNADISASAAIVYSKLSLTASIVNADIASGAAIAYSKLALTNSVVAGDLTTGSVTAAKLGTVTDGVTLDQSGSGSTIEIKAAGVSATQLATGAFDQSTITGGAGTAAAVAKAPVLGTSEVAGESFAATTLFAVRFAKAADSGFVAGRVYKADNDTTSADNFYAIGLVFPGSSVAAAGAISVVEMGVINVPSHGFTVGAPLYLGTAGALTTTAPTTALQAVVKVGMVKDASNIYVQVQTMGVN